MCRCSFALAVIFLTSSICHGESVESADSTHGLTLYERFQGTFSSLGAVTRLDTTVGYQLDSHFSVAGGIPIYFVRPSASTTAAIGNRAANGVGNVYGQFRLTLANPIVNFASTVVVYAPTGDQSTGFSTGHVTADWSNYFEHSFDRLTPFGEIGIANSVSDTLFFVRPYTTLGFVTHLQGGGRYKLRRGLNAAASVYAIVPSGQQTVVSRLVSAQPSSSTSSAGKSNGKGGVFQTSNVTTGPAEIARDHGFSMWLQFSPAGILDFYTGYTRSVQYGLNTLFVGVGVNVGKAIRQGGF